MAKNNRDYVPMAESKVQVLYSGEDVGYFLGILGAVKKQAYYHGRTISIYHAW